MGAGFMKVDVLPIGEVSDVFVFRFQYWLASLVPSVTPLVFVVLGMGAEFMKAVVLPIGEVSDVFRFQYWSIPKIDPDGGPEFPEKLNPEKSYEFDELNGVGMLPVLSPPHAYKGDVEFRNSVIGEFGLGGPSCALCDMAG